MVLPFSLAIRAKVAMAFSVFPVRMSKRGLSGSHCVTQSSFQSLTPACFQILEIVIAAEILTKQKQTNITNGTVDRPSSHLQPRVGITHNASRTSNTVPTAQNA